MEAHNPSRDLFHEQALNHGTSLSRDAVVIETLDKLAVTVLTVVVLLPAVRVTMLLIF
jgi:hypothetical protein